MSTEFWCHPLRQHLKFTDSGSPSRFRILNPGLWEIQAGERWLWREVQGKAIGKTEWSREQVKISRFQFFNKILCTIWNAIPQFLKFLPKPKPTVSRSVITASRRGNGWRFLSAFHDFFYIYLLTLQIVLVSFIHVSIHMPQQLNIKMAVLLTNQEMLVFLYSYNTYNSLKVK